MFKNKPQPTFDDVASDEAKRTRELISAAAQCRLKQAAQLAIEGRDEEAGYAHSEYAKLRSLAISIPLDMVAEGL